jgi:hypothetical protein
VLDGFEPTAPLGLTLTNRDATKDEDGDWVLTLTYEGITNDQPGDIIAELDYSSVEDPIETNPKFDLLAEKWKARLIPGEDGQKEFKGWRFTIPDPAGGSKPIKNPFFGISHFLNDNVILRLSFVTRNYLPELLKNINKISTPLYPRDQQQIIEPPEGKQWLKRTVKAQFRGNAWRYSMEWHLGVWAPDLYTPNA